MTELLTLEDPGFPDEGPASLVLTEEKNLRHGEHLILEVFEGHGYASIILNDYRAAVLLSELHQFIRRPGGAAAKSKISDEVLKELDDI